LFNFDFGAGAYAILFATGLNYRIHGKPLYSHFGKPMIIHLTALAVKGKHAAIFWGLFKGIRYLGLLTGKQSNSPHFKSPKLV
jgi:hypothetical protein